MSRLVKVPPIAADAKLRDRRQAGAADAQFFLVTPTAGWTLPAVVFTPANPRGTTLVVADRGRTNLADVVHSLLARQEQVCVADLLFTGECSQGNRDYLFGLLFSAVGERPLGVAAGQVSGLTGWLSELSGRERISVWAEGPRVSLSVLTAAALDTPTLGDVHLHQSLGSLKEILERNLRVEDGVELFCFGLLEEFDILQLAALATPRQVGFRDLSAAQKSALAPLKDFQELFQAR